MTLVLFFIAQGALGVLLGYYLGRKTLQSLYISGSDKKNVSHNQNIEFHLLDVFFPIGPGKTRMTQVILFRTFTANGYLEIYLNPDDSPAIAAWFAEAGLRVNDEAEDELQGVAD